MPGFVGRNRKISVHEAMINNTPTSRATEPSATTHKRIHARIHHPQHKKKSIHVSVIRNTHAKVRPWVRRPLRTKRSVHGCIVGNTQNDPLMAPSSATHKTGPSMDPSSTTMGPSSTTQTRVRPWMFHPQHSKKVHPRVHHPQHARRSVQ